MYLRKSSESEDRQALSLEAQEDELRTLAERVGVVVVGEPLREARSAKLAGTRPVFRSMLERIRAGEADGILCWHLNRLARNMREAGELADDVSLGVIKEIRTPTQTYSAGNSDGQLIAAFQFVMATKYVDDLSRDVKRGNRKALEHGRWPGKPKLGYLRDRDTMELVPDPERFPIIREMWTLLLQGDLPSDIHRYAVKVRGLSTPTRRRMGGRPLSRSSMYAMFRDPFYAGLMIRAGQAYRGTHPPVLSWAEFRHAQRILDSRRHGTERPQRHTFTYRGLLTCGACGAGVTAKNTTNRHGTVYRHYFCSRKSRSDKCPEGAVREEVIEDALLRFLRDCVLSDAARAFVFEHLDALRHEQLEAAELARAAANQEVAQVDRRLVRLRTLLIDEVIGEKEYQQDKRRLEEEGLHLHERLQRGAQDVIEPLRRLISWLNQAPNAFAAGTDEEKRRTVQALSLNLALRDKTVHILAKKPLRLLSKMPRCPVVSE